MRLGFTGTQHGMSEAQHKNIAQFVLNRTGEITEVHHGDCIGADNDFDDIAVLVNIRRISHPCTIPGKRAFCACEVIMPERPPLIRNRIIVDSVDWMLAAPDSVRERTRSGTWSTIRYAKKVKRPLIVFFPDGGQEDFVW